MYYIDYDYKFLSLDVIVINNFFEYVRRLVNGKCSLGLSFIHNFNFSINSSLFFGMGIKSLTFW